MSIMEKKVDAMARFCLAETLADRKAAMDQLRELMTDQNQGGSPDMTLLIGEALKDLGVPCGIMGYQYLLDAISATVVDPNAVRNMTNRDGVYEVVVKRNDTTFSRAERAIRHAIEVGWNRTDIDVAMQYFGGTIDPNKGKPTNRGFIAQVARIVRQQLNN